MVSRYLRVGRAEKVLNGQVLGVTPAFQQMLRLAVARGRFLSGADEASLARVAAIGAGLARELFGYRDPLGETITIAADHYRVIGVLQRAWRQPRARQPGLAQHQPGRVRAAADA